MLVYGAAFWRDTWSLLDLAGILFSDLDLILSLTPWLSAYSAVRALRMLRTLRIFRLLNTIPELQELTEVRLRASSCVRACVCL